MSRPRGASRRLQRAICDFGADEAFATAGAKLREHYGLHLATERVRRVCLQHARSIAARPHRPTRTLAARGAGAIVTEADGTMIPMVDCSSAVPGADRRKQCKTAWQEMRLVAAQAQGEVRTCYAAALGPQEQIGTLWGAVVGQAGWAPDTFIHGIGDGAEWIHEQFRQHFAAHGRYTLDLFHVCDYLAAAAPEPHAAAGFVAQQREALKANRHDQVIGELATRVEPAHLPNELAPVRCAHRYLAKRVEQLDYQTALARHLPIGSGLIESGHRHVLHARLKKPGAWCSPPNAHALAQMRVLRANRLWDSYWTQN